MALTLSTELTEAETQLTRCRAAILRAMDGVGYTIGEQSVQRQRLEELRNTESALLRRINAITQSIAGGPSGGASVATFQ